jgi:F-type H+-transporting ATPase subunit alpha
MSVSRVGSAAQTKAMKAVSGNIKIEMAQYNELSSFSQFSSDLDSSTKAILENGSKVVEILKQPQCHCLRNSEHVVILHLIMSGHFADIDIAKIKRFEDDLLASIRAESEVLDVIDRDGILSDETKTEIRAFCASFKERWKALNG